MKFLSPLQATSLTLTGTLATANNTLDDGTGVSVFISTMNLNQNGGSAANNYSSSINFKSRTPGGVAQNANIIADPNGNLYLNNVNNIVGNGGVIAKNNTLDDGTGKSIFTGYMSIQYAGGPRFELKDNTAGTDVKRFDIINQSGNLYFRFVNDIDTAATVFMQVSRSGVTPTGITFSAPIALARNQLQQPQIKDYSEVLITNAAVTGAVTLNLSTGNNFDLTLTGATTLTFSNPAPSGQVHSMTLFVNQGATAFAVTFPASVKWASDVVPDLSAINKTSVLTFVTKNGGTRWYGFLAANGLVT
jgi:hypothetical protein